MELEALSKISYGVYLVTGQKEGKKVGCVVNSIIQVTSQEPYVLIAMNKRNATSKLIKETKCLGVSILSKDVKLETIGVFGYYSSDMIDKFQNVLYEEIKTIPIVKEGANAYFIVDVKETIELNTHLMFVGKVIEAEVLNETPSLTYEDYHQMKKGQQSGDETWECEVCGYEYHGDLSKLGHYVCPICGVAKEKFKKSRLHSTT